MHNIFKKISDLIENDAVIKTKSSSLTVKGLQYRFLDYTVNPSIVAGIIAVFLGVFITVCKTVYDTLLRERLEGGSRLSHAIIDNCVVIFTGLLLLLVNNRVNYYKKKFDDDRLESAVLKLAEKVPLYKELLMQAGAKYQASQIIHVNTNESESVPLLGAIARTVNHFRFGSYG